MAEHGQTVISDDLQEKQQLPELLEASSIWQMVVQVKAMLPSLGDGEISSSAYDTAWVAMVPDLGGTGVPQFPSSLRWVANNQLDDGSWGDAAFFFAPDRIISTVACVVALKSWNSYAKKCERGIRFLKENMWRLAEVEDELITIGFEVALPSLLDIAKAMSLEFPYDEPALQRIYAKREMKLNKIPRELMHSMPTTLLGSVEGMPGLDWERLLKLQSSDGSFLSSPSSTAYVLMQTGNEKCLRYLQKAVDKYNGGVPTVYPVDLFEHLWVVDRLQRLGLSHFFETDFQYCIDYVYKNWRKCGICWASNLEMRDVGDTAMAFRLLRLHGYDVSSDVFRYFEKEGEFFCFVGQLNQAITAMYNLNRAAQLMFPSEETLKRARDFSYHFLREKQASNQLLDKWIISKDLPSEVEYTLSWPFYASLARVEARSYVEQYGGDGDVWIGKSLYRMPLVNNSVYLELAKADFNRCQAVHQHEWMGMQKWFEERRLEDRGVSRESLLMSFFVAAASIYEPERAPERLGWARTAFLVEAIPCFVDGCQRGDDLVPLLMDLLDLTAVAPKQAESPKQFLKQLRHAMSFLISVANACVLLPRLS
ncbi:hypothetical protein HPP92_024561 [Vanilla planifolia]|uniref:Terpene synthase N-terminal domain-containing protein n=1 Tax=Vanilla planifolia TaxID=51239 RepID=A0A835UD21_VANPL|nr:hypothetical protein HPP92_024561 [Vanilla planifolia]